MQNLQKPKRYDLEERTLQFAKNIRTFVQNLPKTISNLEDSKQLIRSSGSIGANYIEANEALSKKDFKMRIMISRKEAKETCFWLKLIAVPDEKQKLELLQEATELTKIFGAIYEKSK